MVKMDDDNDSSSSSVSIHAHDSEEERPMDVESPVEASEDDEEEILLYVDFPDFDESNLFDLSKDATIELSGLMEATPSCRISNLNFVGRHEINLGTQLFFRSNGHGAIGNSKLTQQHASKEEPCVYLGKTNSVLRFKLQSIDKPDK
jgi:hypothetical protein